MQRWPVWQVHCREEQIFAKIKSKSHNSHEWYCTQVWKSIIATVVYVAGFLYFTWDRSCIGLLQNVWIVPCLKTWNVFHTHCPCQFYSYPQWILSQSHSPCLWWTTVQSTTSQLSTVLWVILVHGHCSYHPILQSTTHLKRFLAESSNGCNQRMPTAAESLQLKLWWRHLSR